MPPDCHRDRIRAGIQAGRHRDVDLVEPRKPRRQSAERDIRGLAADHHDGFCPGLGERRRGGSRVAAWRLVRHGSQAVGEERDGLSSARRIVRADHLKARIQGGGDSRNFEEGRRIGGERHSDDVSVRKVDRHLDLRGTLSRQLPGNVDVHLARTHVGRMARHTDARRRYIEAHDDVVDRQRRHRRRGVREVAQAGTKESDVGPGRYWFPGFKTCRVHSGSDRGLLSGETREGRPLSARRGGERIAAGL